MKIVYCVYELGVGGGIERVLTSRVNYLKAQGYDISILTCDYNGRPTAYGIDPSIPITNFGINYAEDFCVPLHKRIINTIRKMRIHKKMMTEYLMRERPDIVVTTQLVETSFLPSIGDGSKKVQELHGSYLMYRQEKKPKPFTLHSLLVHSYSWRDAYFLRKFDAVGCLTEEDYTLRGKPRNMYVIPNAIPFTPIGQATLDDKIILAVGRFTSQKDFASLIEIWHSVAHKYPQWKLRIVGEGYLQDTLEKQIQRLKLSSSIELLPFDKDIQAYYLGASIYAMTSRFEGMPMTLIEAQSLGLPIVSYSCPCGPRDIITQGETGYIVTPGDKADFAGKLEQLIEDAELRKRMGASAVVASNRYNIGSVMTQWEDLFRKLVEEK